MVRNKNKRIKGRKRKMPTQRKNDAPLKFKSFVTKAKGALLWLSATGLFVMIANFIFSFLIGDVEVSYQKPAGRGYEFKLINKNSTDQIIESFRIAPDFKQEFVFKITNDVYGTLTENGVSIPGGNTTYMPAYEYKGMDGYILPAKSDITFRIPPLVARDYMQPEYIVVFVQYKTRSRNKFMNMIETALSTLNFRNREKKVKYLVVKNHWTPMSSDSPTTALKAACRDDDIFAKTSICEPYK